MLFIPLTSNLVSCLLPVNFVYILIDIYGALNKLGHFTCKSPGIQLTLAQENNEGVSWRAPWPQAQLGPRLQHRNEPASLPTPRPFSTLPASSSGTLCPCGVVVVMATGSFRLF